MQNLSELLYKAYCDCPNGLAYHDEEGEITFANAYRKVLGRASLLSHMKIKDEPIIVFVNRRCDCLLWFFAISLSGNAYIPLDEGTPKGKLEHIISQTKARYYVGNHEGTTLTKIEEKDVKTMQFGDFYSDFNENSIAYILFTSGSTGVPKGVKKSHKNVLRFIENFVLTFPYLEKERIANQTPFFFDASAKDIYLALYLSSPLFIVDKVTFALPLETINYLNKHEITYICWVPSILVMIAKTRTLKYETPRFLKYLFFVGEVFPPKYLKMWKEAMPELKTVNLYGSTEVAGVSLYYEVGEINGDEAIPAGKPLANNEVYLKEGEIIIESDQVSLGYIDESLNTAFFVTQNGKRALATGDYAKLDEGGNIVFVSRKDYQIKHLGYRIELQDIEASLTSLDYVDACACLYDEKKMRIVAFIILNQDIEGARERIMQDAKEKLPYYMVPNKVEFIEKMPLNANGKTDRGALKERIG